MSDCKIGAWEINTRPSWGGNVARGARRCKLWKWQEFILLLNSRWLLCLLQIDIYVLASCYIRYHIFYAFGIHMLTLESRKIRFITTGNSLIRHSNHCSLYPDRRRGRGRAWPPWHGGASDVTWQRDINTRRRKDSGWRQAPSAWAPARIQGILWCSLILIYHILWLIMLYNIIVDPFYHIRSLYLACARTRVRVDLPHIPATTAINPVSLPSIDASPAISISAPVCNDVADGSNIEYTNNGIIWCVGRIEMIYIFSSFVLMITDFCTDCYNINLPRQQDSPPPALHIVRSSYRNTDNYKYIIHALSYLSMLILCT